uniref:Uncharacterized protein n=1 Tax=Rhizophora mucronata TaxID=61149 RepID=A0A2P2PR72_RHIMU
MKKASQEVYYNLPAILSDIVRGGSGRSKRILSGNGLGSSYSCSVLSCFCCSILAKEDSIFVI